MSHGSCQMVTCHMVPFKWLRVICHMVTCFVSNATCLLSHISCHIISSAIFFKSAIRGFLAGKWGKQFLILFGIYNFLNVCKALFIELAAKVLTTIECSSNFRYSNTLLTMLTVHHSASTALPGHILSMTVINTKSKLSLQGLFISARKSLLLLPATALLSPK